MNLRKDHSCDRLAIVMVGWRADAMSVLSRLWCPKTPQSCIIMCFALWYVCSMLALVKWIISATDVLVHMLMKGAAKCNNHCELQNSVNQLTIERRSALGAFLRACLCQCFHIFIVFYLSKMTVHQAILFDASSFVAAVLGACYLHCCEHDVDCFCEAHEHDIKQSNLLNLSI